MINIYRPSEVSYCNEIQLKTLCRMNIVVTHTEIQCSKLLIMGANVTSYGNITVMYPLYM